MSTKGGSSAQPLESGTFYSILHPTQGIHGRVRRCEGRATVERAGFVDLGVIKGNIGDQNYAPGSGLDLAKYRAVSIWCKRFSVNFGAAALRPTEVSQNH
jgi:hypothetical protein